MSFHRRKSRKSWSINANRKKSRLRIDREKASLARFDAEIAAETPVGKCLICQ